MNQDPNLEQYLDPTVVFTDPSITPNPPTAFVPVVTPYGVQTYLVGLPAAQQKYSGGLWHIVRPVLANTGNLQLSFLYNPDSALAKNAQAIEFDRRPVGPKGEIYAFDSQLVPNVQGLLDWMLSPNGTDWDDTGLDFPMPPANQWTPFSYTDAFNIEDGTYSFGSLRIGDVIQHAPPQFQKLPAIVLADPWTPNDFVFQKQLDAQLGLNPYSDGMKYIDAYWY
jgi:hypothetical protein